MALGSADTRKLESTPTDSSTSLNALKKAPDGDGIGLFGRFLDDQRTIWTSPTRIRFSDMTWLVPAGGLTAGLLVTDRDFSAHISHDPKTMSHYNTLSNAGLAALIGGAGGLWLMGHASHNKHWKETGFLAGEASINSLVAVEAVKYSLRRQRPFQGDGSGAFFQGGTSFPSEHAAAAWSVAGVIAHEYPGPFTKIVAYGLASLVDYSRIRSRQHFPSDVFVGSIMGNLIAQNIYSRHHDPELGGAPWQSISQIFRSDGNSSPANQGSPYVPLDSWVYPALDHLAALGLIDSSFAGLRPWTRQECARMLNAAQDKTDGTGNQNAVVSDLLAVLQREFRTETESATSSQNAAVRLESAYVRTEHISGMPLTDGYHFAQTQINDFGRPYGEGWNSVTGFSTYATWGRWVGYARGELQTSPSVPALPLSARQFVAASDGIPSLPPSTALPSVQQLQLLDAYVGLTFSNWEISFGKQSVDWGPGEGGPMMFSNNAAPVKMFRINRVSPILLPSLLKFLGPMRMEFFIGQLDGHEFAISSSGTIIGSRSQTLNPQPFIDGEKVSFKPTRNIEVGLSYGTIFGAAGVPVTVGTFVNSLFDTGPTRPNDGALAGRRTGIDFTYRIPKLRRWLTLYADGFAQDQIVFLPYGYPERAVWRAGVYVPQFPGAPKLDFRAEGVYTDNPLGGAFNQGYYYLANRYLNGYTNNGQVIGSWIGRQGQGVQTWIDYWFSARNRLQLSLRHQKVSQTFVPGGGTLTDLGARGDWWVHSNVNFSAVVQHERWLFPVIAQRAQRNVSASLQLTYWPTQRHIAAKN